MSNRQYQYNNKVTRQHEKIAEKYSASAMLPKLIGERLFEKLAFIKLKPMRVLDLGAGTGTFLKPLKAQFPKATIYGADIALSMLAVNKRQQKWRHKFPLIAADAMQLPFSNDSFDFIFMNLLLPFCLDLPTTFKEISRVLKPDGLLLFSSCGPDTLKELKAAWKNVDDYAHIDEFVDMHDLADILLQQGFSDPVVDMEMLTVNYQSIKQLLDDLKQAGSVNKAEQPFKGLYTRHLSQKIASNYPVINHHYPATVEIIYGHAWGKTLTSNVASADGTVSIAINQIGRKR